MVRFGTREKSRTLRVTTVALSVSAMAAIFRSFVPMFSFCLRRSFGMLNGIDREV